MDKIAKVTHFDEWIHINNFDIEHIEILLTIKAIYCDTRDFHIIANIISHDMGLKDRVKYPQSVIKDTEIFKFLKQLYNKLNDKSEWQVVRNLNESPRSESRRFKYIRFYRITNDEFIIIINLLDKLLMNNIHIFKMEGL